MDPPAASHRERRWTPLAGIFLVILFVSFGGFVVAAPGEGPAEARAEEVLPGVTITLPPGWERVGPLEVPVGEAGDVLVGVRFNRGTGNLDLFAVEGFGGPPEDLYLAYVVEVLQPAASQMQHSEVLEGVTTEQGLHGARGSYVGAFTGVSSPIEGEITGLIAPGNAAVIFDGWAVEGQLHRWAADLREMVRTSEVG
jgi:hypothetical protein